MVRPEFRPKSAWLLCPVTGERWPGEPALWYVLIMSPALDLLMPELESESQTTLLVVFPGPHLLSIFLRSSGHLLGLSKLFSSSLRKKSRSIIFSSAFFISPHYLLRKLYIPRDIYVYFRPKVPCLQPLKVHEHNEYCHCNLYLALTEYIAQIIYTGTVVINKYLFI